MLLVSSRVSLFSATIDAPTSKLPSRLQSPLFRSYGRILPSSFTMIISIALVFSTYPPVSVWGTGSSRTRSRRFSRQHRIIRIRTTKVAPLITSQAHVRPDLPGQTPYRLNTANQYGARLPSCVPPQLAYYKIGLQTQRSGNRSPHDRLACLASLTSAGSFSRRYGNINPLSIDYACRPRLRTRLTQGRLA